MARYRMQGMADLIVGVILGAMYFGLIGYCWGHAVGRRIEAEATLDTLKGDRK